MKKTIRSTKGFREFQKIIDMRNFTKEKIERLEARSRRLTRRIMQIEPTGWKEFLQVIMYAFICLMNLSLFLKGTHRIPLH